MKFWSMTDTGLVRHENQDACGVYTLTDGRILAVVCDGMGGVQGGSVASNLAVDTLLIAARELLTPDMTPAQLREAMSFCVARANTAIYSLAQERTDCHGMGTTLVSAVTCGESIVISNVGDSRAYRISGGTIRRVSKDHSLVEEMVDCGDITAEEARRHPNRNYITRALGPDPQADCDGYIEPLEKGDCFLLCTDGLVDTVSDQQMCSIITQLPPEDCLEQLFLLARENGAPDNVTAVLLWND